MPTNIVAVLLGFAAPLLHAFANLVDGYLVNRVYRRLTTLILFTAVANTFLLPIILMIDHSIWLNCKLVLVAVLIALLEVLYQYPYYFALRRMDTSIVAGLFSLGKVFTPIFALALVGERLTLLQYAGFLFIVVCSGLLSFDLTRLRFNSAFWLMLLVSVALSIQSVLYKYAFDHGANWGPLLLWSTVAELVIATLLAVSRRPLPSVRSALSKLRLVTPPMLLAQILTWGGAAAGTYALLALPVSVVKGMDGIQPVIVLVIAAAISGTGRTIFLKERLGARNLLIKSGLLLLVAAGSWLVSSPW